MTLARLKETFLRLPRHTKFIAIGALVLGVSVFLPWYADLDSYRIGDEFLGVTGPTSFVGFVVLILSGLSLWLVSYHLIERKMPRLGVREGIAYLFAAGQSIFLLLLVNSIYFHPKFGVNITLKESRFGMFFAFGGAVLFFIGAYLKNKAESEKTDDVGRLEPLISYERQHTPVGSSATESDAHEKERSFLFGENPAEAKTDESKKPYSGSYKIRMDL